PQSRVIIAIRDKHELETSGLLADNIYGVDKLKENDAPHDYKELSKKFVKYDGGIHLALKVRNEIGRAHATLRPETETGPNHPYDTVKL
ncbi:hypothetical protein Prudu_012510, partial [Prunus dulcis]